MPNSLLTWHTKWNEEHCCRWRIFKGQKTRLNADLNHLDNLLDWSEICTDITSDNTDLDEIWSVFSSIYSRNEQLSFKSVAEKAVPKQQHVRRHVNFGNKAFWSATTRYQNCAKILTPLRTRGWHCLSLCSSRRFVIFWLLSFD